MKSFCWFLIGLNAGLLFLWIAAGAMPFALLSVTSAFFAFLGVKHNEDAE